MREVWHGSDPSGLERDTGPAGPSIRNQLGTPALIGWWWALFLISRFLGNIMMSFSQNHTLDELQALSALLVFSELLDVPAVVVAVSLVGRITGWQAQRAERIRQMGTQPPSASVPSPG
jgi:hypothetical protein